MVRFEEGRYIIEVETGADPVESWQETYKEMIYLIGLIDADNCPADGLCYLTQLMGDMMPAWETARRMVK